MSVPLTVRGLGRSLAVALSLAATVGMGSASAQQAAVRAGGGVRPNVVWLGAQVDAGRHVGLHLQLDGGVGDETALGTVIGLFVLIPTAPDWRLRAVVGNGVVVGSGKGSDGHYVDGGLRLAVAVERRGWFVEAAANSRKRPGPTLTVGRVFRR